MNACNRRIACCGLGVLAAIGLCGCVAGIGYGGGVRATYLGGYYEPDGYDYGGWQNGYRVGPPRGGERRPDQSAAHAYRAPPHSHSVPSIPGRARGH